LRNSLFISLYLCFSLSISLFPFLSPFPLPLSPCSLSQLLLLPFLLLPFSLPFPYFFSFIPFPQSSLPPPLLPASCSREVLTKSGHHYYHLRRTENSFPNPIIPNLWKIFEFDLNIYIDGPTQHHRQFALTVAQHVLSSHRRQSNNFQQLLCNISLAPNFLASEWFLNVYLMCSLNKQDENCGAFAHCLIFACSLLIPLPISLKLKVSFSSVAKQCTFYE